MPTSQGNPGWVTIWILEITYVDRAPFMAQYPSLPEAHAALRNFMVNHSEGISQGAISEGRMRTTPFLTQEP